MLFRSLSTQAHASVPLSDIEALVHSVNRPETEAIFVSCTDFRTLGIIEKLEQKLGKPVISSNSASMWKMLRLLGDRRVVPGAGQLFREAERSGGNIRKAG